MHADEIQTDAHLVARLLAGQFPQWAKVPIQPAPSAGTDNALYRLGHNRLPEDVRDLFRATLEVDDATWARGRGWALTIALIQLPCYRDTNPALAANASDGVEWDTNHRFQPSSRGAHERLGRGGVRR
jgi:aminoglycoside phosphotransferase (APT) family kinase protein